MGDEKHGLAGLSPDAQEFGLHDFAGLRVQGGKGLVHDEDLRVDGERPRQIAALLHTAGEFMRIVILKSLQARPA